MVLLEKGVLAQLSKSWVKFEIGIFQFPQGEQMVNEQKPGGRKFIVAGKFCQFGDDVYMLLNNLFIKYFIMQKTVITTPAKKPGIKYFKYEMKDTNQLLKDLISCNISETLSRSGQNRQQIHNHYRASQKTCLVKLQDNETLQTKRKSAIRRLNEIDYNFNSRQKTILKYQTQQQNFQDSMVKDLIYESGSHIKKIRQQNPMEDLILQKIFIDFSEDEDDQEPQKPSFQKYKNKQLQFNPNQKIEQSKQSKKQKKGLANISLRVKTIVSQHKKLTYKQVSDLVLQYSKTEIDQLSQSQKIRQIKNIKRRVYDALNVLVAVGILGKQQRCVCITQWTNVPGKKLSNQWQKINSKIQYINKLKKNCSQKSQALQVMIDKYNAMAALQKKHEFQQIISKNWRQDIKLQQNESLNHLQTQKECQQRKEDKKFMFPIILFCPVHEQDPDDKLTIQLEYEQTNSEEQSDGKREKAKISGKNIAILGDFDCALEMNLDCYRDRDNQNKLLQQIENYAQQCIKKRNPTPNNINEQDPGQNIEAYFNEQMFESN